MNFQEIKNSKRPLPPDPPPHPPQHEDEDEDDGDNDDDLRVPAKEAVLLGDNPLEAFTSTFTLGGQLPKSAD